MKQRYRFPARNLTQTGGPRIMPRSDDRGAGIEAEQDPPGDLERAATRRRAASSCDVAPAPIEHRVAGDGVHAGRVVQRSIGRAASRTAVTRPRRWRGRHRCERLVRGPAVQVARAASVEHRARRPIQALGLAERDLGRRPFRERVKLPAGTFTVASSVKRSIMLRAAPTAHAASAAPSCAHSGIQLKTSFRRPAGAERLEGPIGRDLDVGELVVVASRGAHAGDVPRVEDRGPRSIGKIARRGSGCRRR